MPAPIVFTDAAAYDRSIGAWSAATGADFLDWLAPPPGLRWLDVGCGSGVFTTLLAERAAPAALCGIDPEPAQLAFAARRPALAGAVLQQGDAMALPAADAAFDAAVMALVIFFVPDPARGLAEMRRAVRPGGLVAAYAWDIPHGGFPSDPVQQALRQVTGAEPSFPPHAAIATPEALGALWRAGGLAEVEAISLRTERHFPDFATFWAQASGFGAAAAALAALTPAARAAVEAETRARVRIAADGRVSHTATASAVRGIRPG
ncbi:MAG: methyltransferase domain-containing protein [Rhodospirillales bacterium]|nr:methyltransferase domain-containing protein [Rhodospirillales bacterium]